MQSAKLFTAAALAGGLLSGCASSYGYGDETWADACSRDYERNRAAATAAGALVGAAAGAAVAGKDDRAMGAAVGAVAGGLIGRELSKKDDPCGYGFGGYPYDPRYGYWDERLGRWVRR